MKKTQPQAEVALTYTEVGRAVDEDGWPVVRCLRSDGKKVKMPIKRFRELQKLGQVNEAPAPVKPTEGAGIPKPVAFQLAAKYREAVSPSGFFAIHCGDHRTTIIAGLGCNWDELLCYDHELNRTVHLKRRDLAPLDAVDSAIELLRHLG